jgi:ribokinase
LARAGAETKHFGKIGTDGKWILELMEAAGVDVENVGIGALPTGKAIIQVCDGENAIILYPGANYSIQNCELDCFFDKISNQWVLLQNELNTEATAYAIEIAFQKGCIICFNPAPCVDGICKTIPLKKIHILILNDIESVQISKEFSLNGFEGPRDRLHVIMTHLPQLLVCVITLGKDGVVAAYREKDIEIIEERVKRKVDAVDTTGAGDTFIGFFLALLCRTKLSKSSVQDALQIAVKASGICCESKGAIPSIPTMDQVR